jgi:hypothetical protein
VWTDIVVPPVCIAPGAFRARPNQTKDRHLKRKLVNLEPDGETGSDGGGSRTSTSARCCGSSPISLHPLIIVIILPLASEISPTVASTVAKNVHPDAAATASRRPSDNPQGPTMRILVASLATAAALVAGPASAQPGRGARRRPTCQAWVRPPGEIPDARGMDDGLRLSALRSGGPLPAGVVTRRSPSSDGWTANCKGKPKHPLTLAG